ncbi:unnamed protein product [Lactuca saligna]|uniref:Transposase MuDR plant domain-containing protein n=1 Tax=Lactuca saligna TaxID=75948 RepID=A0AA36E2C6_LACSI|nr:unnamed protein product [Lactuca saligna]
MASDSKQSKYLTVYLHYNGLFAPKPLVYLNAVVVSICDVDFGAMDFKDFNLFIAKLIEGSCDNVYYCTRNEPLAEGIRRISNDADYFEFIETGYSDEAGLRMNVYIDHENEPVLDWADDEGHYFDEDLDDDKDSQLSDDIPYEHEADDYIPSFDKTIGDEFLHRVSGMCKDINDEAETDEVETKNGDDKPVYPVHNENQKWDKMVPILGMRFSNPMELKNCLTNYAVKNGYNLYFEKNDSQRLKISKLKKQQRFWGVIPSGIQQYEVRIGNDGYAVDLNNNTCGCRSWQVSGKVEPVQVDPVQADLVDPVQVPAPQVDPVQADPVDPVDDPHPDVDVPAQPVATRQRIRKYSERITKIGLRRKVLKKEGSTGHNPMVLE